MINRRIQRRSSFDSLVPLSASSSPFRLRDQTDVRIVKAVLEELAIEAPVKGLGGLSERFGDAGLKDVLYGWITSRSHTTLSRDRLEPLMGKDYLAQLQQATGID